MFSRKRSETKDLKMADAHHDSRSPMNPARPVGAPASAPVGPPRTPELARAADLMRLADSSLRRPSELPDPPKPDGEIRQLSVGRGITLSGDITSCEKLSIEGSVEANLINCRALDIAESGLFKGTTSIEEAEVRGCFEGNLTVRKRLLIKSTGISAIPMAACWSGRCSRQDPMSGRARWPAIMSALPAALQSGSGSAPMYWSAAQIGRFRFSRSALKAIPA
jgi:hypothetical protein